MALPFARTHAALGADRFGPSLAGLMVADRLSESVRRTAGRLEGQIRMEIVGMILYTERRSTSACGKLPNLHTNQETSQR